MTTITVSSRLLAVLDTFGPQQHSLSLSEIARQSGLPLPTAHRFIRELVNWGGLERSTGGRYRIGTKLWGLTNSASWTETFRQAAGAHLYEVARATGAVAQLAILDGERALCVETAAPSVDVARCQRPGAALPLHAAALGRILLVLGPDRLRAQVLSGPLERLTPYTLVHRKLLAESLERVRQSGYCLAWEQTALGMVSLAVPVPDCGWEAAVSLTAPSHLLKEHSWLRQLRLAAVRIRDSARPTASPRAGAPSA